MDDIPVLPVAPTKNTGHKFQVGHLRFGGRAKGTPDRSKVLPSPVESCIKLAVNPFEEMWRLYVTGKLIDPDGRIHAIDPRTRVKLLIRCVEHTHSRAPVTQVVAAEIEHKHTESLNVDVIMRDPALSQAAETLALALLDDADYGTTFKQQ